ncbi:hypothetical protein [Desertibacillus haloalkaliphilus]|nr:hypothetical protein [Desertibacillus haloalkaliphilus]
MSRRWFKELALRKEGCLNDKRVTGEPEIISGCFLYKSVHEIVFF